MRSQRFFVALLVVSALAVFSLGVTSPVQGRTTLVGTLAELQHEVGARRARTRAHVGRSNARKPGSMR